MAHSPHELSTAAPSPSNTPHVPIPKTVSSANQFSAADLRELANAARQITLCISNEARPHRLTTYSAQRSYV